MTNLIANHPVQFDEDVQRVFVGIPDSLPPDQLIRLQALNTAAQQLRFKEDADGHVTLAIADRYAKFIATGQIAATDHLTDTAEDR